MTPALLQAATIDAARFMGHESSYAKSPPYGHPGPGKPSLVAIPLGIRDHSGRIGDARHGRGWLRTLSGASHAVFLSYASHQIRRRPSSVVHQYGGKRASR
jgi:hypothetical protein